MNHTARSAILAAVVAATAGLCAGAPPGGAQPATQPAAGTAPAGGRLRAEIHLSRTLYRPGEPVPVRFTLFNGGDGPVEIPVAAPDVGGPIALPAEVVFGSADEPALFLQYETDPPVALSAPTASAPAGVAPGVLRLAPQASLGAEVDLRALHRSLRYSGRFRLRWKPLGGRAGAVEAEFRIEPRKMAVLVTDYGKITFHLMYDRAPRNVENLLELIRDRFYDGLTFHRIIPGFIVQGGSPDGSPAGIRPDGRLVPAEFHDAPFRPGTLAMARKPSDPDSASCQFFISLARLKELDGKYTVVGQAEDEDSLRTLQRISEVPTDAEHRPVRPVVIRFFTLIDEPPEGRDRVRTLQAP